MNHSDLRADHGSADASFAADRQPTTPDELPLTNAGWSASCDIQQSGPGAYCARAELSFQGVLRARVLLAGAYASRESARQALAVRVTEVLGDRERHAAGVPVAT
ncbi:MAG: hypothetical protein REJ50_14435 [Bordetella sp.]|nr:hypothetical protein [Bordetella sp.]